MKFKENDMRIRIDGMGIVFYSPETNKKFRKAVTFLKKNIQSLKMWQDTLRKGMLLAFAQEPPGILPSNLEKGIQTKVYWTNTQLQFVWELIFKMKSCV